MGHFAVQQKLKEHGKSTIIGKNKNLKKKKDSVSTVDQDTDHRWKKRQGQREVVIDFRK